MSESQKLDMAVKIVLEKLHRIEVSIKEFEEPSYRSVFDVKPNKAKFRKDIAKFKTNMAWVGQLDWKITVIKGKLKRLCPDDRRWH